MITLSASQPPPQDCGAGPHPSPSPRHVKTVMGVCVHTCIHPVTQGYAGFPCPTLLACRWPSWTHTLYVHTGNDVKCNLF